MKIFFKYGSLTLLTLIFFAFLLKGRIPHETFDSERWKNWGGMQIEAEWSLRWDMMNSLRNKHNLKNKTIEEIIDLLGEPDNKDGRIFYYSLGMAKRGIDVGTLAIFFGETGKVIDFNVRRS